MHQASIFIVDDHPLVRHGLRQLIEGEPHLSVCGEAASIHQTLRRITKSKPDLAIVDLSLPDGNGLELVKHLLARYPELSILISSMHDETMFAERAMKAGAKGYISKSETGDEVLNAVRKVLNGENYLSQQIADQLALKNINSPKAAEQSPVGRLSNRELEVFEHIARGSGTSEIARNLHLSIKTIESHRANIKRKLGLATAGELTRSAIQWSLESNHLE